MGMGVLVGGTGVLVGGTGVSVGGTGVLVGGIGVAVGGTGVAVGGVVGEAALAGRGPIHQKVRGALGSLMVSISPS